MTTKLASHVHAHAPHREKRGQHDHQQQRQSELQGSKTICCARNCGHYESTAELKTLQVGRCWCESCRRSQTAHQDERTHHALVNLVSELVRHRKVC